MATTIHFDALAERAHQRIAEEARPNVGPAPSLEHLTEMMNVSFFASILEEEGRPTTFGIAYASPKIVEENQYRAFRFRTPVDLEPGKIAKLAPSTHRDHTLVGVYPNSRGTLEIWGLIEVGDHTFSIDMRIRPLFLVVAAHGSGSLSISHGSREVLAYSRGQHHFRKHNDVTVAKILSSVTGSGAMAREFERIAARMMLLGHGGALLLVEKTARRKSVKMHKHYTFKPCNRVLKDAFEQDEAFKTNRVARSVDEPVMQYARRMRDAERKHQGAIDHVARLTAVDGGVLMTKDLSVLGYGVTIVGGSKMPRLSLFDPSKDSEPRAVDASPFPGHRHRSAIAFCAAQKGIGVALVASQDGVLSLFGRLDDGSVVAVRPLTA